MFDEYELEKKKDEQHRCKILEERSLIITLAGMHAYET